MFAEIGNGFKRNRDKFSFEPADLARLYSSEKRGETEYAIKSFEDYIKKVSFILDDLGDWSPYDIFYWETRVTNWIARRLRELEYSHSVFTPYNSRYVLEALASPNWQDRLDRKIQSLIIDNSNGIEKAVSRFELDPGAHLGYPKLPR
jgi:hypothetical protein